MPYLVNRHCSIFEGAFENSPIPLLHVSLRLKKDEGQYDSGLWEPSEGRSEPQPLSWESQSGGVDTDWQ